MPPTHRDLTDYYREVAPLLAQHLATGPVREVPLATSPPTSQPPPLRPGSSDAPPPTAGPVTAADLLARLDGGPVAFSTVPGHRVAIHLVPGDGADSATAATAALQLCEQCAADGLSPVPLTDGADGLWILARTTGDARTAGTRYADLLTSSAPELATGDPATADGRCLVTVPAPGEFVVPVPYTALPGGDGGRAAVPLHPDEIAAIAAGMPAEFDPSDVGARVGARGDLAAALLDSAGG